MSSRCEFKFCYQDWYYSENTRLSRNACFFTHTFSFQNIHSIRQTDLNCVNCFELSALSKAKLGAIQRQPVSLLKHRSCFCTMYLILLVIVSLIISNTFQFFLSLIQCQKNHMPSIEFDSTQ